MPSCCYECFAFDDNGDHPMCLVTKECKGYTFRAREQKMDKCPLKKIPDRHVVVDSGYISDFACGWNACINEITR